MIEELASVVAIKSIDGLGKQVIVVESNIKSSCGGCKQIDSCGSGQIAKAIPQRKLSVEISTNLPVKIGDVLVLGLSEKSILKSAGQVYLWPLIGLISSSAFGQWLVQKAILPSEPYAIVLGFLGGYLGYRLAKHYQQNAKNASALMPKILRIQ